MGTQEWQQHQIRLPWCRGYHQQVAPFLPLPLLLLINDTKLVVGGVTWPPQASWNPPSSMLTSPASLGPWWFSEEDHKELEKVLTWILIPLMATPMAGPMSLAAPTLNCQPGNLPPQKSESPDQLHTCPQVGRTYLWKVVRMRFESIYSVQNRSQNPSTTRTASIHPRNNICG